MEPTAVMFLTTGRCGTQWLARHLGEVCSEYATVAHEPLGARYRPASFFRNGHPKRQLEVPDIARHVGFVEEQLRDRSYIETGWPSFAAIPLFLDLLGGGVKIVHLSRHPIPSAVSHMVHQTYRGSPRRDPYTRHAALGPDSPGIVQTGYAERWASLTPFEKTLFWWTEVHHFADELRALHPDVGLIHIRSEEIFSGSALRDLMTFLDLPGADELEDRRSLREDQWRHRTHLDFDPTLIYEHPLALEVAANLGYDVDDYDRDRLEQRYRREGWDPTTA